MKRLPFVLSFMMTVLALFAWGMLFATSDLVWDDLQFVRRFEAAPWASAFGPFEFGQTYWRPLGTASLALGMSSSSLFGVEAAVAGSKWASLGIFAAACFFVLSHVERAGAMSRGKNASAALALAALYLACAPVFAESTIWLSARYDLLLSVVVAYGVWDASRPDKSTARGLAIGLMLGLCKESGVAWAVLAGSLSYRYGEKAYGRGLVVGGVAFAMSRWAAIAAGRHFSPLFASAGISVEASSSCPNGPVAPLPGAGALDALQSLGREALYAFLPWLDTNPLHPYWNSALWTSALGLAVLGAAVAYAGKIASVGEHRLERAWLGSAITMLIFHAALSAFVIAPGEMHSYAIVSGRYVSSSAIVFIATACAWLARGQSRRFSAGAWCVAIAIVAGNCSEAIASREAWSSGMALWGAAWRDVEHRSVLPTENYILELAMAGDQRSAWKVADEFARSRQPGFDACRFDALSKRSR